MSKPRFLFPHKAIRTIGILLTASGLLSIGTAVQFHGFANGLDAIIFYTGWMEVFCYNSLPLGLIIGLFGMYSGLTYSAGSQKSLYLAPLSASLIAVYGALLYRVIKESEGFFDALHLSTINPNFWAAFAVFISVLLSAKSAAFHIDTERHLFETTESK